MTGDNIIITVEGTSGIVQSSDSKLACQRGFGQLLLHYKLHCILVRTIYCDATRRTEINRHLAKTVSYTSLFFIHTTCCDNSKILPHLPSKYSEERTLGTLKPAKTKSLPIRSLLSIQYSACMITIQCISHVVRLDSMYVFSTKNPTMPRLLDIFIVSILHCCRFFVKGALCWRGLQQHDRHVYAQTTSYCDF